MKKELNSSGFNVSAGNNVNLCVKGEFYCQDNYANGKYASKGVTLKDIYLLPPLAEDVVKRSNYSFNLTCAFSD